MPTYNEATNRRAIVAAIHDALREASILIVDDASPDGTGQLVGALVARDPALEVLHRSGKQGPPSQIRSARVSPPHCAVGPGQGHHSSPRCHCCGDAPGPAPG